MTLDGRDPGQREWVRLGLPTGGSLTLAYARRSASSGLTRSTSEGPVEVFDLMGVVPSAPSKRGATGA
jgi:hypothetical protein